MTLLALNGREKDLLLKITRDGVVLVTTSDGKVQDLRTCRA